MRVYVEIKRSRCTVDSRTEGQLEICRAINCRDTPFSLAPASLETGSTVMIFSFPIIKSTRKSDLPDARLGLERQVPIRRSPCSQPVRARRSGVLTLFALLMLVISIGMLMLVLNTAWLVLNNRDMQRRSDLLALVAT